MIKIVADSAIPFLEGVFEPYANIVYKEGSSICRDDLVDADALIVRTRTKCDRELLEGTSVKIIATATIGMDHIDTEYCHDSGIYVMNSSGCNAGGVMNYVFSALYGTASRSSINLNALTMGIIGVGSVGSRVEKMARYLGYKVLLNDPPREAREGPGTFCSLDYLLENSDIVTMHVPLLESTRNMADADFFAKMKDGAFFINAARGEIVDEEALMEAVPKLGPVIIDTWNHEPEINQRLMTVVDVATPHIAGYSYQGKQNGTAMAVRSVARFFSIEELYQFYPETVVDTMGSVKLDLYGKTQGEIAAIFQYNYPIFTDDFMFRMNPGGFEDLRTKYRYRNEFYVEWIH